MSADYSQLYADAGQQYGVDPELLKAQGQVESNFNPQAVGPDTKYGNAVGIAQLIPATAQALGVTDPTDPKQAIFAQAKLMKENLDRYGDPVTAVMAYHGGTDPDNWGPKTKAYAGKVMANYQPDQIEQLLSGSAPVSASANDAAPDQIEQLLSGPVTTKTQAPATASQPSAATDVAETIPSSIVKGIGAIPQIPAMAGNAVGGALGYLATQAHDVLSSNKLTDAQKASIIKGFQPYYTGNTPADALAQAAGAAPNSLTGSVLHDPQTTPGRFANALTQGLIEGPAAGAGVTSSVLGATGAQTGSELYPGNSLAPVVGGLAGLAGGKASADAVSPTPLPADVADVIQGAQDKFGITVPSAIMTGGNNLLERVAGKTDASAMNSQINRTAADLIGANDGGEGHQTINQDAFLSAKRNNGAAYNQLDAAIGNVPLDNHLSAIADVLKEADQPRFDKISADLYSRLNPDGSISSSDIRDLTGYGSNLRKYANSPNEDISEPATNLIALLKQSLKDKATPEQQAQLAATDNKYKLMSDFEKVAREAGAGSQVKPEIIRDVINKSYGSVNDYETPAKDLGNLLNTIASKKAYQNPLNGLAGNSKTSSNFLPNAELGASLLMGEPMTGIALRYAPKIASNAASRLVNSGWYRNKLLENAGY